MKSIAKAKSKNFNDKIKNLINPYESKIKINEIIKIILKINNNDKILRKKFID